MFGKDTAADMVPLLVDHLDKVIEVGERLIDARYRMFPITAEMTGDDIIAEHGRQREFLEAMRALELTMAARIAKSRDWVKELRARDGRLKLVASLFISGTQALADAMEDIGDPRRQHFNGASEALFFLKSRALVADHVTTIDDVAEFHAGERYRVAGVIEVEPLLDLTATFIDALDIHYNLFGSGQDQAAPTGKPALARMH